MAGDNHHKPRKEPIEEQLLRRLRAISIIVVLVCIVLASFADTLGRLFINPEFHSSEVIIGTLVGALIVLLGIEVVNRIPGVPKE